MTEYSLTSFLTLLALFSLTTPGVAKVALEEALPENTLLLAKVNDATQLRKASAEHPLLTLWREDDVEKFFAPLYAAWEKESLGQKLKEEFDLDYERLQEIFPGQVALAVTKIALPKSKEEEVEINLALLADYAGDLDTIKKVMHRSTSDNVNKDNDPNSQIVEEEFLNVTLYLNEVKGKEEHHYVNGWAVVKGILVVATPVELLRDIVSRIAKESSSAALVESASFRKVKDQSEKTDLLFYLNLEPLVKLLYKAVDHHSAAAVTPNAMGITTDLILQALALDVLECLYISIALKKEWTAINSGLFYTEKRGLVSLLTYKDGDLPQVTFVPENVLAASISLFSLSEFWIKLEGLAFSVSPALAGLYASFMEQLKTNTGVDLRVNLIQNLSHEIITFSGFGPELKVSDKINFDDLTQVYVFSFKDRLGFELALETLKTQFLGEAAVFEKREYLGTTIFTQKNLNPSQSTESSMKLFSYALTDKYLFLSLGSATLLETALARLNERGGNLWKSDDLNEAIERLPAHASEIKYYDFGAFLNTLFITLAKIQKSTSNGDVDFQYCDPAALPEKKNFPYFFLAKTYSKEEGLFAKSLLLKKSE